MLHRIIEGTGPRVVLVHGFTQTLASWEALASWLAGRYEVARVDLPGHGGSADARLGFPDAAAAIGEAGGRGAYVGYSLGGRLCLRLALDRPDLVTALVLVGASPGLADEVERAQRRRADEARAAAIERDGVDAFLEGWLDQPLFATLPKGAAGIEERRRNPASGLAAALRRLGTGVQEPLWDRLPSMGIPTLLVAGAEDAKFAALAEDMARRIPGARVTLVEGAGHAAHLERPDVFPHAVGDFLVAHHGPAA